jgi:hypothetical protein
MKISMVGDEVRRTLPFTFGALSIGEVFREEDQIFCEIDG